MKTNQRESTRERETERNIQINAFQDNEHKATKDNEYWEMRIKGNEPPLLLLNALREFAELGRVRKNPDRAWQTP